MRNLFALALIFPLGGLLLTTRAQQSCYQNPSLEGPSQAHVVPAPWQACYGSPDTQPGQWGFTQPPSNGTSYVSALHDGYNPNGYAEGMTQLLTPCLVAGQTYTISVDLAHSPIYNTASPGDCPSSLAIYGGNNACGIAETLYTSGPITHTNWQTYNITFTPSQNYCYISFAPYHVQYCSGYINIMIDNFSCVENVAIATTATPVSCAGNCDGLVTATPNTGVPPFTYLWTPGNYTTQTVNNLCAGTYQVLVTDSNGSTATSSVDVLSPQPITASFQTINPLCSGLPSGSAQVSGNGGNGIYSYSWSPGGLTGPYIAGLTAGTYIVTVTDTHGCTGTDSVIINAPAPINISAPQITPISCFGNTNGGISFNLSGGTGNLVSSWNPNIGTGTQVQNLGPGTYILSVVDDNGCTAADTVVLIEPAVLQHSMQNTQVLCHDSANGSATVAPQGGTAPYQFVWSNGQSTGSISGLDTGYYAVVITDANGCTDTGLVAITQPPPLEISLQILDSICQGTSMNLTTQLLSSGAGGVSYVWHNGQGAPSIQPIATSSGPTPIWVNATDANGCTFRIDTLVQVGSLPQMQLTVPDFCAEQAQSFNYQLVNPHGQVLQHLFEMDRNGVPFIGPLDTLNPTFQFNQPGQYTYTVEVETDFGCSTTIQGNFEVFPLPTASFSTDPFCFFEVTLINTSTGGSGALTPTWTVPGWNGDTLILNQNEAVHVFPNVLNADVTLQITDANGCRDDSTQTIDIIGVPDPPAMPDVLVINPETSGNDRLDFTTFAPFFNLCYDYTLHVYNRWGIEVFSTVNSISQPDLTCQACFKSLNQAGQELSNGSYFWVIQGSEGLEMQGRFSIFRRN
jgi:hypothetical protein